MGLGNSLGFGSKGGQGGTGGSFNGNRPITLPGIPNFTGKVLGGNTVVDFLEGLFPAEAPLSGLSASNGTRMFNADPAVVLNYSVTKKTNPITSITVAGQSIPVTGNSQSGVVNTQTQLNTDTTFSMSVQAGNTSSNAVTFVLYRHFRFWFKSSQNLLAMTDVQISAFLNSLPGGTFEFSTVKDQPARSFNCSSEFIYFSNPVAFGQSSFVMNGLANNAFISQAFQFANPNNFVAPFYIHKSGNQLTGTYNVDIN